MCISYRLPQPTAMNAKAVNILVALAGPGSVSFMYAACISLSMKDPHYFCREPIVLREKVGNWHIRLFSWLSNFTCLLPNFLLAYFNFHVKNNNKRTKRQV